jgi:hypothetical protein
VRKKATKAEAGSKGGKKGGGSNKKGGEKQAPPIIGGASSGQLALPPARDQETEEAARRQANAAPVTWNLYTDKRLKHAAAMLVTRSARCWYPHRTSIARAGSSLAGSC